MVFAYQIVEELEDRLSEQIEEILALVRDSLSQTASPETSRTGTMDTQVPKDEDAEGEIVEDLGYSDTGILAEDWDESGMMDYVDTEGAFEGDLDAEDIDE